ncbi:hypothetical protein ACN24M_09425 [Streptomyces microflavus]
MPGGAGGTVGGVLDEPLALLAALGAEDHVRGAEQLVHELPVGRGGPGQRPCSVQELVRLGGGEGRGTGWARAPVRDRWPGVGGAWRSEPWAAGTASSTRPTVSVPG